MGIDKLSKFQFGLCLRVSTLLFSSPNCKGPSNNFLKGPSGNQISCQMFIFIYLNQKKDVYIYSISKNPTHIFKQIATTKMNLDSFKVSSLIYKQTVFMALVFLLLMFKPPISLAFVIISQTIVWHKLLNESIQALLESTLYYACGLFVWLCEWMSLGSLISSQSPFGKSSGLDSWAALLVVEVHLVRVLS